MTDGEHAHIVYAFRRSPRICLGLHLLRERRAVDDVMDRSGLGQTWDSLLDAAYWLGGDLRGR